jgi:hypothetical protein
MHTDIFLFALILYLVAVFIYMAVKKPQQKDEKRTEQHYAQPLPSNLHYVLEVDPLGLFPRYDDPYTTDFRRYRSYM